jgi:tRNA (guanine26-N2/guanine27-N2)-dimethyltransferase
VTATSDVPKYDVPKYWEGAAQFQVGASFYRPASRLSRDLGVLAARCYRQQAGRLRVLDGMTGCGVRSLRYALEAEAEWVWANDADPTVAEVLQTNLAAQLPTHQYQISHQDLRRLLQHCYQAQDYYDLVDLDSFGNPASFLQAALGATRLGGLLYLTSTDGRTTSGQVSAESLRLYGAYSRSHPAHHEQGLRILMGAVAQQAGSLGLRVDPVFSLFRGQIYRVMLRLSRQPWQPDSSGFLGYCHTCGEFQVVPWHRLHQARCDHPDATRPMVLSGPMWLGSLHDPDWLIQMQEQAWHLGWHSLVDLLVSMTAEAALPPYFYTLGEIGRRGRLDVPNRQALITALQVQGYEASATHIDPQAIKTTASLATCIAEARQINHQNT